jgi:hypothetical protein
MDDRIPARLKTGRVVRLAALAIIVIGGNFWLSVYHGASELSMITWVTLLPLVWPIHVMLYQWERGRPILDLLRAPTSRESELALYGRIYCYEAHHIYHASVVSTPWGKLLLFYAGGVVYLMLITVAFIWARPILMAWIGPFHGLLASVVDLIPDWGATNAAWMTGGAVDLAMFRTHVLGLALIAALLFLAYQCYCDIAFFRGHRQQYEKHATILKAKASKVWLFIGIGIGWVAAGFLIIWLSDQPLRGTSDVHARETLTIITMHYIWVVAIGTLNFFFALPLTMAVLRAYIRFMFDSKQSS